VPVRIDIEPMIDIEKLREQLRDIVRELVFEETAALLHAPGARQEALTTIPLNTP
jgi:hypothetical protein